MADRVRRAALAVVAVVFAVLVLGVGTASAHVSVSSPNAAPGGFGEITFAVPTESDTARTTSLMVPLPAATPFASVSVKPVPGWTATTTTAPLPSPVETGHVTITEAVSEVTWTADAGTGLAPGQYQTFSISAGPLPEDADSLAFPALQGYDDGSVVAWIDPTVEGQPEPEHPAPTLRLAAGDATATDPASTAPAASSPDGGTSGLAVIALIAGVVGTLVGAAGVVLALGSRRRSAAPVAPAIRERDTVSV